nr:MAG TPA: glycoprotein [Siphoviridae sp. ctBWu8]
MYTLIICYFDKKIHKFKKIFKPIENTRFKVCANCRNNSIYL